MGGRWGKLVKKNEQIPFWFERNINNDYSLMMKVKSINKTALLTSLMSIQGLIVYIVWRNLFCQDSLNKFYVRNITSTVDRKIFKMYEAVVALHAVANMSADVRSQTLTESLASFEIKF